MIARRILRLLLAVLVTAGLTVAPLVTPAAGPAMASDMQMTDAQGMSADMPCCPDEPNSKQCQDCPLLAICMLKVLQAGPAVMTATRYARALALLRPLDDAIVDGLARPPPDHPPRSIV
ncbi:MULTISPECIES: hypothetical protein [Bradyrhizobium]|uniref:hypothetical protein n=1 Tax=Bradyrhizobium TaxID=374 RepID=UPI001BA4C8E7|nr:MULTISPECIES: hypothetical protein [Bradyrhizobium]MBR0705117.1 hypothetical protein [Bradyrhizobium liaoningense]MDA9401645.1 hypothetical protein [Bradyrhizobium sp. CCBAU 45389]